MNFRRDDDDDEYAPSLYQIQLLGLLSALVEEENEILQMRQFADDNGFDYGTEESYRTLLRELRTHGGDPMCVDIPSRDLLLRIFHTVDEFCEALVDINCLDSLTIGGTDCDNSFDKIDECVVWPKIELDNGEISEAWEKLCRAIHTVCSKGELGEIVLGGYLLSGECMAGLLQALQNMSHKIHLIYIVLPWNTISGNDYRSFVEAISYFQKENMRLEICGDIPASVPREEYLAAEPTNHFVNGGIMSQLSCCLGDSVGFYLERVMLNSQECASLADIVGSSSCSIKSLGLSNCTMPPNGHCIAEALRRNKTIKWLVVTNGGMEDVKFRQELVSSLSLNTSIKSLVVSNDSSPETIRDVLRDVALTNKTITYFRDTSRPSGLADLTTEEKDSLLDVLRQNYTLEAIEGRSCHQRIFPHLTWLNRVGRGYLEDDCASRSKCVAVLAKVKKKPDCLFFHLRENPILCTMYNANETVRELTD